MALHEKIQVVDADGSECFVCEKKMEPRGTAIEVGFNVSLPLVGSKKITKHTHVACAEELHSILGHRIGEAYQRM